MMPKEHDIGVSPSGKATGFDPVMRRFESCHPSHLSPASSESNADTVKDAIVSKLMIFAGNANPELAKAIAQKLHIPMGQATVGRFSDGETTVEIDENVRGHDVFIIQPTCYPTNDNLMELIVMADALRRASATRITAVIPYYGYARQDRRVRSTRVAMRAKVEADMISRIGVDCGLALYLSADQIQVLFDIPVDNIYATTVMLEDIEKQRFENFVVVSPAVGGVVRARAVAKRLDDA